MIVVFRFAVLIVFVCASAGSSNAAQSSPIQLLSADTTLLVQVLKDELRNTPAGKWLDDILTNGDKSTPNGAMLADCGIQADRMTYLLLGFEDVVRLAPSVGFLQGTFDSEAALKCLSQRITSLKRPIKETLLDGKPALVAGGPQDAALVQLSKGFLAFGRQEYLRNANARMGKDQWPAFPADVVALLQQKQSTPARAVLILNEKARSAYGSLSISGGLRGLKYIIVDAGSTIPLTITATGYYDNAVNAEAAAKYFKAFKPEGQGVERLPSKIRTALKSFQYRYQGQQVIGEGQIDPR